MDVLFGRQGLREGGHGPGLRSLQEAVQGLLDPPPARQVGGKAGRLRMHGFQAPFREAVQQRAHGGLAAVEVGRQLRHLHASGREQQALHPQPHARPQLRDAAQLPQLLVLVGGERGVQGGGHGNGVTGARTASLYDNPTCQVGHAKCLDLLDPGLRNSVCQ